MALTKRGKTWHTHTSLSTGNDSGSRSARPTGERHKRKKRNWLHKPQTASCRIRIQALPVSPSDLRLMTTWPPGTWNWHPPAERKRSNCLCSSGPTSRINR